MIILLLVLGCHREADVVDCLDPGLAEDTAACPECSGDGACAFGGNSCTETVYCAPVDGEIAVVQIGCSEALTYRWPDEEECVCDAGVCVYSDD